MALTAPEIYELMRAGQRILNESDALRKQLGLAQQTIGEQTEQIIKQKTMIGQFMGAKSGPQLVEPKSVG